VERLVMYASDSCMTEAEITISLAQAAYQCDVAR